MTTGNIRSIYVTPLSDNGYEYQDFDPLYHCVLQERIFPKSLHGWENKYYKKFYMIGEVLAILKAVISDEKMYDVRNPSIVLCSPELELVLDRKAFHISELTERIMNQVAWAPDYSLEGSKGPSLLNEPSRRNDQTTLVELRGSNCSFYAPVQYKFSIG